jgi:hypothetical protein
MVQDSGFPPSQYGPPEYGPPPKRSRGLLVLIGALVVVLIAVLAVGAVVLLRGDDTKAGSVPKGRPAAPEAVQFRRVIKAVPGSCDAATPAPDGIACGSDGSRYTLGKVELDGTHVTEVKATTGPDASWYVGLSLDGEGTELFGRLTTDLAAKTPPQNQLAIVIRGKVVSAPTVMSPITGGEVQINSSFNKQDSEKLAAEITG